jgi:type IV pilus assembly protein PilA
MSLLNLLEEFIMFEKIRKMKNKKGFTLVELIVVLVILAILAALLIPALTGYIDKANKEKIISETRMVVMAAQTELVEKYGKETSNNSTGSITASSMDTSMIASVKTLAEVKGTINSITYNEKGQVVSVSYSNSGKTCVYSNSASELYSVG